MIIFGYCQVYSIDIIFIIFDYIQYMQERFKKQKNQWMEDFLRAVSSRNILRQSLDPPDPSKPNESLFTPKNFKQYTFETKGSERTIGPPELVLSTDPDLAPTITDKATRTRRTIQASLLSDSPDSPFTRLQQLSPQSSEDLGSLQESKDAFCVGLSLVRQDGTLKTQQRVEYEFRCLSERSGAKYKIEEQHGRPGDLWKLLNRLIRIFIVVEEKEKKLKIGRLAFYPKVDISLRKVKITPFTFVESPALRKLQKTNFAKEALAGYVSLASQGNNAFKFLLLEPYEFQSNPVPLVGVFAAGKLGGPLKHDTLLWSIITEYITNPNIRRRLSMKGDRTGILVLFDENGKNTNFIFQIFQSARWCISTSIETVLSFPLDLRFSTREVIMEEEKEESEAESVQSRPNFVENPPDSFSSRSFDSRDQEIARLKSQLELYKNHCEQLKQIIATLSFQKAAPYPMMPMAMPIGAYPATFNFPQEQPIPVQQTLEYTQAEPYFGKIESQPLQSSRQFRVKDSKNISFAQQNQFQEQQNIQSILANSLDDSDFISPQFRQLKRGPISQQEVKPFEAKEVTKEESSGKYMNSLKKASTMPQTRETYESPKEYKAKQHPIPTRQTKPVSYIPVESNQQSKRYEKITNKYLSSPPKVEQKDKKIEKEQESIKYKDYKNTNSFSPSSPSQARQGNNYYQKYLTGEDSEPSEKVTSPLPQMKKEEPVQKERSVSPKPDTKYKYLQDSDSDEEVDKITQKYKNKKK